MVRVRICIASLLEPKSLDPVTECFVFVCPFILWVAACTGFTQYMLQQVEVWSHPEGVCVFWVDFICKLLQGHVLLAKFVAIAGYGFAVPIFQSCIHFPNIVSHIVNGFLSRNSTMKPMGPCQAFKNWLEMPAICSFQIQFSSLSRLF